MTEEQPKERKPSKELKELRVDKWLWTARFFKTRSAAQEAVEGGRVHVNGIRVKSSKLVTIGCQLDITTRHGRYTVIVRGVVAHRRPAKEAVLLYEETPESQERREREKQERDLKIQDPLGERPDKKQRRQLLKFWDKE